MTAWLPASLKEPSGLLKVPPNYHPPCRGHGGMCFKMDLRCDSHSHSPRLSLSLSLSPFFHPAPFCLMAHTCQEKGCGTAATTCSRAVPVLPGSDHNVLLTVHSPDCVPAHLCKPHHHQQPGGGGGFCSLQIQILFTCFYLRNRTTRNSSNCQSEDLSLAPVGL